MLSSFFPQPKIFFWSLFFWSAFCVFIWFLCFKGIEPTVINHIFGTHFNSLEKTPIIGVKALFTFPLICFYIYFFVVVGIFYIFWGIYSPHSFQVWSIFGSSCIIFSTFIQVELSVVINAWYGPFWDLIQSAVSKPGSVKLSEFYSSMWTIVEVLLLMVLLNTITSFLVSHYIFRWRNAMSDYYLKNWSFLREIEGASQRIQEDTMRFSMIVEGLAIDFVENIMTLIAFTPIFIMLSKHVMELPIIGIIPYPLLFVAVFWSLFGTVILFLVGWKLPGLGFKNQKVEAAFRKELVYGEDDSMRASPEITRKLFNDIRKNYLMMYFHYLYFNVVKYLYLQLDVIIPYVVLGPTIISGKVSLGIITQIMSAFSKVRSSFQYLVSSWSTIIELISIYKRLSSFEKTLENKTSH
ncbi:SbmA protein [Liberibacter crescens BT-1]|uniref:SbmA protein n=1 Tax=Liberibacter crescens (strain BT-1) TaxID=1215343 RepID=L0EY30_LIBCB|nr:peptide antibiotic transporter SbmA [Liberibacter crescens]AGA65291.1 SbmA protein [Liberibacter crescens BT-1]AMC13224.1 microcin B17 transporter [Liberibacter crescens]